jgi:hypothetical protein
MSKNIRARVLDRDTIAQVVVYIEHGGSYSLAADALGVKHSTLIYHCRRLGIPPGKKLGRLVGELPEIPKFKRLRERKVIIKQPKSQVEPIASRFDANNSWYVSCIMKSKMSRKKKKEIIANYNEHKDDSQQIIYNVNIVDFSNIQL